MGVIAMMILTKTCTDIGSIQTSGEINTSVLVLNRVIRETELGPLAH